MNQIPQYPAVSPTFLCPWLDKQIDDFEQRGDSDGLQRDIKLLVRWAVPDVLALATEINSKRH